MHTSAEAELSVLRALDEICTPAAGRWYQDRIDGAHLEISRVRDTLTSATATGPRCWRDSSAPPLVEEGR